MNVIYATTLRLALLLFALYAISFTGQSFAGGGGCTAAALVPCSTPSPTCTDPVFNAGSGGSINCSTATPVSMPGCQSCITGTTVNSADGNSTTFGSCGSVDGIVWFLVTVPAAQNTFTVTPGTLQNAIVIVDNGATCNDNAYNTCGSATGSNPASASWGFSPGDAVIVGVGSTTGSNGTFTLCITSLPPPPTAGNTCATANVICTTNPFSYNMNCATASGQSPSCFTSPPQQDTWIVFTVLQSGTIAWFGDPNANAEFDWALWNITSGCPGTQVSCNYNFAGACGNNFGMTGTTTSGEFSPQVNGTAGQTYAIQIDNFSGNGVGFAFDWTGTAVITPTAGFTMNNNFSCAGSLVVDFTHTGVGNATYNFGNGNTYTGNNPPDQTYGPGTYSVTATATAGACSSLQTSFVTVYEPVSAVVTPVAASCPNTCNGSATVTSVSGGNGIYTYLWSNGSTSNTISNVCPGNYSVTVSNAACGTSAVVNTTIGVANPLPTVTGVINGGTYCQGDVVAPINVNVTGSANWTVNYTLNGTPQTATGSTSPISLGSAAGTYTVTGVTDNFCTNTATGSQTITINPLPTATISGGSSYCSGATVNNVSASVTGTGPWTVNYTLDGTPQTATGSTSPISLGNTPGVYVLTGVQDALCSNTASGSQTITIFPDPVITLTPTDPATCNGSDGSILVSGSGSGNVFWSGTSSSNANGVSLNYTISNLTAGTYNVYFVNGATGCQSATVSTTLLNASSPVLTVSNPAAVCSPATVDLTASASTDIGTISYYTDAAYTNEVSNPTAVGSGTYYVVANNAGCTDEGTITVVVNPTPVAVPSTTTPVICVGQTVILNSTSVSGATYSWSGPNNFTSTTQNPQVTTAATAASGTYTLVVTANGCTSAPATVNVTVNSNPTPVINGPSTYCAGNPAVLSTTETYSTYTWSTGSTSATTTATSADNPITVQVTNSFGCTATSAGVNVSENPAITYNNSITICQGASVTIHGVIQTTSGVYSATFITPSGCDSIANITLIVNPLPAVNAGTDQTVCFGSSVTLSAFGAAIYNWSGGVQNNVPFIPQSTMEYTVTGTDVNGCINSDVVMVTVNSIPVINAGPNQSVCQGTSVTLEGAGGAGYSWSGGISNGVPFVPSVGTNTYTVTGTSPEGCTSTDQVVVVVNPTPAVFAGNDVVVCEGQTVTLTGLGAATYTWDNGINNGVAFVPTLGTTAYTVTGTSSAGCINTDQVNVIVNPNPEVSFLPGETLGCAPFTTSLTNTSTESANCTWTFSNGTTLSGCGTVPVTFTQAGCYNVTLTTTSLSGCTSSFTANNIICVEAPPNASFAPSANQLSNLNTLVNFTNTSTGASNYIWSFGDQSQTSTEVNPSHTYPTEPVGQYEVMLVAFSPFGCTDTAYSFIQIYEELIFYVPNTFTPDSDNFNQVFLPVFTSGFDPYDYKLLIFNRWGEIIFESNNAEIGWDGSYGKNVEVGMCQDGIYTWKIEFKVTRSDERRIAVGHVNLIR